MCEFELRKSQKEDCNGVIQRLHIKRTNKSRFSTPLCRLRGLPLVRPISEVEVQCLECEFVMGYREGDWVMYVSAFNDVPVDLPVPPRLCLRGFLFGKRPVQSLMSSSGMIRILHISLGRRFLSTKAIIDSQHGGGTSTTTTPMRRVSILQWIVLLSILGDAPVYSSMQ